MQNKKILKINQTLTRLTFLFAFMLSLSSCGDKGRWQSPHPQSIYERWIAHAGGQINDTNYTNSLEALNASYHSGMHLFELDFEWTSDKHLVLLHDWTEAVTNTFGEHPGKRSLAEFISFKKLNRFTPMTVEDLFVWLNQHPSVIIITDIKSNQLKALKWIQHHYPFYAERFIPQIYHFEEYEPVRRLGYYRVILTLYRIHKKDRDILNFCKTHPVWAVTMPSKRVFKGTLTMDLRKLHIPVYAHTDNDPEKIITLFKAGVFGIYTDRNDFKNLISLHG